MKRIAKPALKVKSWASYVFYPNNPIHLYSATGFTPQRTLRVRWKLPESAFLELSPNSISMCVLHTEERQGEREYPFSSRRVYRNFPDSRARSCLANWTRSHFGSKQKREQSKSEVFTWAGQVQITFSTDVGLLPLISLDFTTIELGLKFLFYIIRFFFHLTQTDRTGG